MARIIVQTESGGIVLLDEKDVNEAVMGDEHSSLKLIERIAWAVVEAQTYEQHGSIQVAT